MKIEVMKILSEKIEDIDIIKELINVFNKYSQRDIDKIMNALKECDYNENVCDFVVDPDVLENRSIEEQIR